jgi:hypothetical protein
VPLERSLNDSGVIPEHYRELLGLFDWGRLTELILNCFACNFGFVYLGVTGGKKKKGFRVSGAQNYDPKTSE